MDFQLDSQQRLIQGSIRQMVDREIDPVLKASDPDQPLTKEQMQRIFGVCTGQGLTAARIPGSSGGAEMSALTMGLIYEQLPPAIGLAVFAHEGTGARLFLGSRPEQRERFLPDIMSARRIACTGNTEPDVVALLLARVFEPSRLRPRPMSGDAGTLRHGRATADMAGAFIPSCHPQVPTATKEEEAMKRVLSTLALAVSALAIGLPGPMAPAQAAACECRTGSHNTCPQGYHCKTGGCASGGAPSSFNFTGRCFRSQGGGSGVVKPKSFSVQPHGHPPAKRAGPRRLQAR